MKLAEFIEQVASLYASDPQAFDFAYRRAKREANMRAKAEKAAKNAKA
jgi:hypothetical protein